MIRALLLPNLIDIVVIDYPITGTTCTIAYKPAYSAIEGLQVLHYSGDVHIVNKQQVKILNTLPPGYAEGSIDIEHDYKPLINLKGI